MTGDPLSIFSKFFTKAVRAFASGDMAIPSLTGSADAFLALAAAADDGFTMAITPGIPDAERLTDDLKLISARRPHRILELPPPIADDRAAFGARLKTIAAIRAWGIDPYPAVVVAPYQALVAPIPKRPRNAITLSSNGGIGFSDLSRLLGEYGYRRMPAIESEGDYSVRGGIIDAWSPGEEFPVRTEFFGEDLESLRSFDPSTQISIDRIDSAELLPVADDDAAGETETILGILPAKARIIALEHNSYSLAPTGRPVIYTGDPAPKGVAAADFATSSLPGFSELGAGEAHHPELFDAAKQRLERHLDSARAHGTVIAAIDALSGGFEIPGLIVVTKSDHVFAKRHTRMRHHQAQGVRFNDFDEIEPGEYVVHVDYGVGRFIGSSEIMVDGRRREVYTIEYADGARLHVPAAHAHLLSRYIGVKGEAVHLHRLDGKRWEKDRRNAQQAVADLAAALLETQAKREITPGFAYDTGCDGYEAFEAAFPYEETGDQLAAIEAIKADLARSRPMDRLICGDAGYGKTEVAMRAAYIAAMNGRQVAVLAPTTVLAEQHFETFTSRFDGTPIRIESVSRFQSALTHAGTMKRLATGACDIVIGTHAILSAKISFRDLGLIIIDEEQRFGVRQKEFLKRLRATADVLTLSATPIPRTLYLSMTGARDLSLLRTPPRERVAVNTIVIRDDDHAIAAAIERELARGGQVFFLHNRVSTIGHVERRIRALCPKSRVVVAHGQMDSMTLARKMRAFELGEFDILLSTTIIESGIDIPRANTIIIDRADTFGLADLYQLRGRVGRSSREGFAYFLLPPSGIVDSEARERLAALKRHGGLGSGFNLAVRDLELRGAGNLLGSQQSGHIASIGFNLYCQLLKRTVAMMKGERVRDVIDVKLNLDFSDAVIPHGYIEDDVQRMTFIRRFAEAQDARDIAALVTELKDRYGPLPDEAVEFVELSRLRLAAAKAGIGHIDAKGPRAILYRHKTREVALVCDLTGGSVAAKIAAIRKAIDAERQQNLRRVRA